MAEEPKTPPAGTPPAGNEGGQGGSGEGAGKAPETKTFTQAELDKVVSDRLNKENEKFDKKLEEKLKAERQEWERQQKLSDEEKQKELQERQQREFAEREKSVTLRENKAIAIEKFAELGLPVKLVDFVVDLDQEKQGTKIEALKTAYNEAVEAGVAAKMSGKPPKAVTPSNPNSASNEPEPQFMGI